MPRSLLIALGVCGCIALLVFTVACGWIAYDAHQAISQTAQVESGLAQALKTINTPKSGTLSMLDDTILQGRLTIDATNRVLIHEQAQLTTLDDYARHLDTDLSGLSKHADTTLTSLDGIGPETTKTLSQAKTDLGTLNQSLDALADPQTGIAPVVKDFHGLVRDADGLVTDPDVRRTLGNVADTAQNASVITGNAAKVTTHVEQAVDNPKKMTGWQKFKAGLEVAWKIAVLAK